MNDVIDDIECQSTSYQYIKDFSTRRKARDPESRVNDTSFTLTFLAYINCGLSVSIIFSNVITITTTLLL